MQDDTLGVSRYLTRNEESLSRVEAPPRSRFWIFVYRPSSREGGLAQSPVITCRNQVSPWWKTSKLRRPCRFIPMGEGRNPNWGWVNIYTWTAPEVTGPVQGDRQLYKMDLLTVLDEKLMKELGLWRWRNEEHEAPNPRNFRLPSLQLSLSNLLDNLQEIR